MAAELTVRPFFWRATRLFPGTEVVARTASGTTRYTYADFGDRVRLFAGALAARGLGEGDRVGTLGWNHHRHLEAYYGVPLSGAQLHTINAQLHDDHIVHIVDDAADDALLVDPGDPLETIVRLWDRLDAVDDVIVMAESVPAVDGVEALPVSAYEDVLAAADPMTDWPELHGDMPAGMCYTSGTTGPPKGVEYTHGMIYAHAMMVMTPAAIGIEESDVVMSVVPMFHVNSWEFPYAATMAGAKQVHPGPSPDAATLVDLIESEGVTLTAGVPTIWIDVLEHLDDHGGDLSSLERIVVGGSAAPKEVMRRYADEYDVTIEHAWGMTETMSIGSVSRPKGRMATRGRDELFDIRAKQGLLSPGMEMTVVDDAGDPVPWDGESFGELLVRGPTVVSEYHARPDADEAEFAEPATGGRWLRTGDIVAVDADGYLEIVDRAKDVIKSGGEWISSIALENELMAHEGVREAAVVAVEDDRWRERPLACVVPAADADVTPDSLREFVAGAFPRWWLPDEIRFVDAIPKTATGKFDKKVLREEIDEASLPWTPDAAEREEER
ncbi:long-chain fatty acid--CoA ligase [Haloferacaceae archaeon DSL9]